MGPAEQLMAECLVDLAVRHLPPEVHDEVDPGEEDGDPACPPLNETGQHSEASTVDERDSGTHQDPGNPVEEVEEVAQLLQHVHTHAISA